jgi:hypothetical protein
MNSTSAIPDEAHSIPGLPTGDEPPVLDYELNEIFLIIYKDGSHLTERYFGLRSKDSENNKDHLKRAINRAFQFCERCRYRFVHCQSFIMDLDAVEKKFAL